MRIESNRGTAVNYKRVTVTLYLIGIGLILAHVLTDFSAWSLLSGVIVNSIAQFFFAPRAHIKTLEVLDGGVVYKHGNTTRIYPLESVREVSTNNKGTIIFIANEMQDLKVRGFSELQEFITHIKLQYPTIKYTTVGA